MIKMNPNHIDGFVEKLSTTNKFKFSNFGKFISPLEVKCSCSNNSFSVYKDTKPTVIAKCSHCEKEIEIYNLKYYPAAATINEYRPLQRYVSDDGDDIFNLCVVYEYSDEFELDSDDFDRNDITWCLVYGLGLKSNKVFEIINDETA